MHRHLAGTALVFAALLALSGTFAANAATDATVVSPGARPSLTGVDGAQASGTITVTGRAFTPGGRVYVALYDVWGTALYETRWTTASPTV